MAFSSLVAGQKFGRLTVLSFDLVQSRDKRATQVKVACECGTEKSIWAAGLKNGRIKSCGCLRREVLVSGGRKTHGLRGHPLYSTWSSMHHRCRNLENPHYGGKGVTVAKEWDDPAVFVAWALGHGWQEGLEIDRVDSDGPYSPENCRWLPGRYNIKRARAGWDPDFAAKVAQYASDHGLTIGRLITLAVEDKVGL
jgi:hypothetical protein